MKIKTGDWFFEERAKKFPTEVNALKMFAEVMSSLVLKIFSGKAFEYEKLREYSIWASVWTVLLLLV